MAIPNHVKNISNKMCDSQDEITLKLHKANLKLIKNAFENDDQSDCDESERNPIDWAENTLIGLCVEH